MFVGVLELVLKHAPQAQHSFVDIFPWQSTPDRFRGNVMLDDGTHKAVEFLDFDSSGILRQKNLQADHRERPPLLASGVLLVAVAALRLIKHQH